MKSINTINPDMQQFRASLDNLDHALVCLLAERFRVTNQVGLYKHAHGLPAQDKARESKQLARIQLLANEAGLEPQFAAKFLRLILDESVVNHKKIQKKANP